MTDAPVDNEGKGEAFSPTDLVATALASCMLTIMGIVAERNNVELKGTTAEVEKIMGTMPRQISEIKIKILFNKNFNKIINKWDYGKSFTQFKDYWLMLTRDHGRVIKAKKNNVFIEGVFENIDDQGNLILRVGNKKEIINTGEIFR